LNTAKSGGVQLKVPGVGRCAWVGPGCSAGDESTRGRPHSPWRIYELALEYRRTAKPQKMRVATVTSAAASAS